MILPTKRISAERSLLGVGARLLTHATEPKSVSQLWHDYRRDVESGAGRPVGFDWFVLALDLLFTMGLVELSGDLIMRTANDN